MDLKEDKLVITSDGKSFSTEEVHFTGGLRGIEVEGGWALTPLPPVGSDGIQAVIFRTATEHEQFANECGSYRIGSCIKYRHAEDRAPMDIWEPLVRGPKKDLNAADAWSAVAFSAREAGDNEYAECASYVSACLQVAGLRLRDVSNGYHEQLRWALLEDRRLGVWFANAHMRELYADFHSLASELCSARDHLARLAAIEIGTGSQIDSLARLEDWEKRNKTKVSLKNLIAKVLLFELGTKARPGWLRKLGGRGTRCSTKFL